MNKTLAEKQEEANFQESYEYDSNELHTKIERLEKRIKILEEQVEVLNQESDEDKHEEQE